MKREELTVKNCKLYNGRILVKEIELEESGAIMVPDQGGESSVFCQVVKTPLYDFYYEFGAKIKVHQEVDEIVIIPKMVGKKVEIEGEDYINVHSKEVLMSF